MVASVVFCFALFIQAIVSQQVGTDLFGSGAEYYHPRSGSYLDTDVGPFGSSADFGSAGLGGLGYVRPPVHPDITIYPGPGVYPAPTVYPSPTVYPGPNVYPVYPTIDPGFGGCGYVPNIRPPYYGGYGGYAGATQGSTFAGAHPFPLL